MNLIFVDSDEECAKHLPDLYKYEKIILDTETTGLDSWTAKLRLIQICSASIEDIDAYMITATEMP